MRLLLEVIYFGIRDLYVAQHFVLELAVKFVRGVVASIGLKNAAFWVIVIRAVFSSVDMKRLQLSRLMNYPSHISIWQQRQQDGFWT